MSPSLGGPETGRVFAGLDQRIEAGFNAGRVFLIGYAKPLGRSRDDFYDTTAVGDKLIGNDGYKKFCFRV